MKKHILILSALLSLQVACGKLAQDSKGTSVNELSKCMDCVLGTDEINAKVAATNAALDDANQVTNSVNVSSLLTNPSGLVESKAFDGLVSKLKDLIAKVEETKTKIDVNLAKLDPVLQAALVLQLKSAKDRLTKIQNDILAARDRLVAKLVELRTKIDTAITKLPAAAQIVLIMTGIDMKIYGFVDAAIAKLMEVHI